MQNRNSGGNRGVGRRPRPRAVAALIALLTVAAGACNPIFGDDAGPVRKATLTTRGDAAYTYQGAPDAEGIVAHAAVDDHDGGVREFFWNSDDPYYADQQTCITWDTVAPTADGHHPQPGLALRIAPAGADGTGIRGITINQNVMYHYWSVLWVNTWDTTRGDKPYEAVEDFDVPLIVGDLRFDDDGGLALDPVSPPWHLCARTDGLDLTFKVWTHRQTEPDWDDPYHVFHTTLPEGWDHAGYSGGYIGHLHDGQTATFSGFTTTPLCLAPDQIDTPRCQALAGAQASH